MTPSVRRPLLRAGGWTKEGFRGLDKAADAIFQAKGTARTSQKHDGPPKRAVLSSNPWYRPARLPAGAGLGAAGPPFQEFAIQGSAVRRGRGGGRCSNRRNNRRRRRGA